MKKYSIYLFAAATALLSAACSSGSDSAGADPEVTFTTEVTRTDVQTALGSGAQMNVYLSQTGTVVSKTAVLHQGLIQQCSPLPGWERILAAELSQAPVFLSSPAPWPGFEADLAALCRAKYCSPDWEDETHGRRRPTRS